MAIRKNKQSGVPAKATKAVAAKPKTGEKKKISLNDDFVDTYITAVTEQEDAMPITF